MPIQATVPVIAEIRSVSTPTSFTVDRASARRGSVQLRNAATLQVYSNDPVGYQLRVAIVSPRVVSADVDGLARRAVTVTSSPTLVPISVSGGGGATGTTTYTMGFTFKLAPGTVEGTVVPWPLQFNVVPN